MVLFRWRAKDCCRHSNAQRRRAAGLPEGGLSHRKRQGCGTIAGFSLPGMNNSIPFNKPLVSEVGHRYVAEALSSGKQSGDGPFTQRCHALLESLLGVPKVLLSTSCTHALEMTALLLHLQPGDRGHYAFPSPLPLRPMHLLCGVHALYSRISGATH